MKMDTELLKKEESLIADGRPRVDHDYSYYRNLSLRVAVVGDRLLERLFEVHKEPREDIADELKGICK